MEVRKKHPLFVVQYLYITVLCVITLIAVGATFSVQRYAEDVQRDTRLRATLYEQQTLLQKIRTNLGKFHAEESHDATFALLKSSCSELVIKAIQFDSLYHEIAHDVDHAAMPNDSVYSCISELRELSHTINNQLQFLVKLSNDNASDSEIGSDTQVAMLRSLSEMNYHLLHVGSKEVQHPLEKALEFERKELAMFLVVGVISVLFGFVLLVPVTNIAHRHFEELTNLRVEKTRSEDLAIINKQLEEEIAVRTEQLRNSNLELSSKEEKYRTIFENIQDAYFKIDRHGNFIDCSPSIERHCGYSVQEVLGSKIQDTHFCKAEDYQTLLRVLLQSGSVEDYYVQMIRRDASLYHASLNARVIRSADNKVVAIEGVVRDVTSRYNINLELRKKSEQLLHAQRIAKLGAFEFNVQKKTFTWDEQTNLILEFETRSCTYQTLLDIVHPDDLAHVKKSYYNAIKNRTPFAIDYRLVMNDGRVKYVHGILDSDGEYEDGCTILLGTLQNVTEQKAAEQHTQRLASIIENSPDLIAIIDSELKRIYANAAFKKTLQIEDEFDRVNTNNLIHDADYHKRLVEEILPYAEEYGTWNGEKTWLDKFGNKIETSQVIICHKDERGKAQYYSTIARDIRKEKAQAELLRKRFEFENLVASISVEFIHLPSSQIDHGIERALRAMSVFIDADAAYLVQNNFSVCSHAWSLSSVDKRKTPLVLNKESFLLWMDRLHQGDTICISDTHNTAENATIIAKLHAEQIGSAVFIPLFVNSVLEGYIGFESKMAHPEWDNDAVILLSMLSNVIANALRRKQAEEQLIAAKVSAESANRAKSAFLSSMSHELRTPLNSILGFAQILLRDATLAERQRGYIEMMNSSGRHLLDMINDVLDLSKLEADRLELVNEEFPLHDLLRDVESMFMLRAREKNLSLTLNIDETVPRFVTADAKRLRQVLMNLVSNAIKYTTIGSVDILVSAKPSEYSDVDSVHFSVSDTGRGIDNAKLESIFSPFKQSSAGYSEGTGLGLAIAHRIVSMMGGSLRVESEVEKGSTFSFALDVLTHAEPINKEPNYIPVVGIKGNAKYKVLIADDIQSNIAVVKALLEPLGFVCILAQNGQEAVQFTKQFKPDFCLIDLHMPVMDGITAVQIIRSSDYGTHIPIFALTASSFKGKRNELLANGFTEYISKPFRESQLFQAIEMHTPIEFERKELRSNTSIYSTSALAPAPANIADAIRALPNDVRNKLAEAVELQMLDDIIEIIRQNELDENNTPMLSLLRAAEQGSYKLISDCSEALGL